MRILFKYELNIVISLVKSSIMCNLHLKLHIIELTVERLAFIVEFASLLTYRAAATISSWRAPEGCPDTSVSRVRVPVPGDPRETWRA